MQALKAYGIGEENSRRLSTENQPMAKARKQPQSAAAKSAKENGKSESQKM
jgi:hypothetical protein